jgi:EmrB/QacA subfamily drug resistance transporter
MAAQASSFQEPYVKQQPAGGPAPNGALVDHDEPQYLSHSQILGVMVGIMSGMFLAALDQSIVGVALPRITSDLGGLEHLAWVVTAYLLTSTASTPLWGKISDLYGRKKIFQAAIVIFLIGSMLCGLAQNMPQLIAFRALQGIGGGGLMSIALAIIGDVIPPRERGRYQGYFGAVFGVSSVAGPLLGGWITDAISWRWIFYINVPVGIAALILTTISLKMPLPRRQHAIDYLGAAIVVAGVSSLLLYLNWAGEHWGWGDPRALALLIASIVLTVVFVLAENRAQEPVLPMRLFKNAIFSVGNAYGFIVGLAMFGGIIFLPLYFQGVMGMSPTESGLAMVPMVAGILSMSIISGLLITRTGRYKIFPVAGAAVIVVALLLLSTLEVDTPYWQIAIYALIFGLGLGMTMQTVMVAVQNAISMRDMGVATSSLTFTRSLGGAIGTALFGAVLNTQVKTHVTDLVAAFPNPAQLDRETIRTGISNIQAMGAIPEPERGLVLTAYTDSLTDLFLFAIPFVVVAFVIALFLREVPLRTKMDVPEGKTVAEVMAEDGEPQPSDQTPVGMMH